MLLAASAAAAPTPEGPIDLLTEANLQIDGAAPDDLSGWSVAGAGDVNGDGIADVIIGAPSADNNGRTDSGSAYVIYGNPAPATPVDLDDLTAAQGFRIDGEAFSQAGTAVAGIGDVNGDGIDDVIVGAQNAANNGRTDSGSAYVIYGGAAPTSAIDLHELTPAQGFRIDGATDEAYVGSSVAGAGDVNGDGIVDVIVGAPGARNNGRSFSGSAYVIYGGAAPTAAIDLADLGASQGFRIDGAAQYDYAGMAVAGAGDVNGDGVADVIVGAPYSGPSSTPELGSAYVIYGGATPPPAIDLSALDAAQGFRVEGASDYDLAGISVAGAGDVNDDGIDDVIIGARSAGSNGRHGSGSAYVIYGGAGPAGPIDLIALDATQGFRIDGAAPGDRAGSSVAGAGDVNGDGIADVIVGAPRAAHNSRSQSGSAYVVYGTPTPALLDLATFTPEHGLRIDGATAQDQTGGAVAGVGDVNGDGFDDVIVGGTEVSNNGRAYSGAAYVVHGFGPAATLDGTTLDFGGRTLGAGPGASLSIAVQSTGQVPLRPQAPTIVGPDAERFAIVSDTCAGAVLDAGEGCAVEVSFTPTAVGPADATLVIGFDGAASSRHVALSGTGVAPPAPPATDDPPAPAAPPATDDPPAPAGPPAARAPEAPLVPGVCAIPPAPEGDGGQIRLTGGQFVIDQRMAIEAILRANALSARMDGRPVPVRPERRPGRITMSAAQLRINQRISQVAVHRTHVLLARIEGRPEPVRPERRPGRITMSAAQLRINQRISITALRGVAAIDTCLVVAGR